MASYYRALIAYLLQQGCHLVRQGNGSHEIWYSPLTKRHFTIPYDCQKRFTCMAICKQAGVAKPDFLQ